MRQDEHDRADRDWWRQAVVYQVYPRSFADGNGDGIGDFLGVLERIDHFSALGVDAVWFSPFYPSALADGGYDVDDYRDVAPELGTLAAFDAVVEALHARGIRVVIDIVPNHSSDRHERFVAALADGPGSAARKHYLFRDGRGDGGHLPPNDWQSFFGGPAWTRVDDGQWYLHLFTPQQPDWNWQHEAVREDFLETLRFWGDRGVDGFRVDVAMCLAKDLSEPYPDWDTVRANLPLPGGLGQASAFADGQHPFLDRDELVGIYATWREVFESYDPPLFAVGETWVENHRRVRYASPETLGQAFNFEFLWNPWEAKRFVDVIDENLRLADEAGSSSTWVLSNHDIIRHPTRYAPSAVPPALRINAAIPLSAEAREQGLRRAQAATLLALALPGSTYLYQGEELGLHEVVDLPVSARQDPQARTVEGFFATRDGCRVPLPWNGSSPLHGFSTSASHLPQPAWFSETSVEAQEGSPDSTLSLYKAAIALRREFTGAERLDWVDAGANTVAFCRPGGWISVTNFGDTPIDLPPGRVLLSNVDTTGHRLPPDGGVWLATHAAR
ncbi:glycoside hydrolase family 13 protein [Microbacterium sp. EYE_5]|uniref:glycoside hydrolase family 13 protein n=1 Tax=unclassified Microbacterium TaxID=2609290 RepID=UPI0020058376|nr:MULTISPECIES: alpha-amylase family glycosyl hydrolase [unclassified Microbacterium]MCK6079392.1 glycoside hydrolase family 13 protein [Microbacterium sp. EYE_382]MCK6084662.1 glycoside hydrolase family 13 protein [Microbacterium sp. EYE_384]MCK6123109.1 glycoside hydrolase family 13 protein [Microbacterium sp. EYE_80]MCK6125426.1 glycoside hydrolase family 13 protein [Microbacterium sp. EYE_79]MCK6140346.1 glycoside hydrolase family 13 protein [Microbacterium sp. EYE_39]